MFENKCNVCYESITDPVCINCYIKQVRIWFIDIKVNPIFKKFIIEKLKNKFSDEKLNDTSCILCNNYDVNLCFYCFFSATIEILNEMNLPENMIENFTESFNYELMGKNFTSE